MVNKTSKHTKDLDCTHGLFMAGVDKLVGKIKPDLYKYKDIFAIPRGGYILGVILSHRLKLPMTRQLKVGTTLIVDDICDKGNTLAEYLYNDKVVLMAKNAGIKNTKNLIYAYNIGDNVWVKYWWEEE